MIELKPSKKLIIITILFGLFCVVKVNGDCPAPYSNCNLGKDGFINVHIVSHTHDDVGWLKTVDQYYYGANNDEQLASVQYILDTVVAELEKDPQKRFVYVEIAYFWRWWNEQNDSTKELVRTLVSEGRLEFVIGAWCMNDEATVYYTDVIDQQTLGLKFILKEFGECARPRAAWQIDPFGHSREQGSLFAQFGFDGLFLGRVDYQDFENRGNSKTREMLWQASANLGTQGQIFTGVLPHGYNPPDGFCFDIYCGDDPIMDDKNLDDYNVDQKVDDFIKYTLDQQNSYKTSNLIMTMGSDFQYSNAHMWFKNLDKLIYYVNQRQNNGSKINLFYSTTGCYLYSLYKSNTTWPVKTDDFFPYAHRPHSFWTGYFTSRAALKDYVRRSSNYLQAVRQLAAFADLNDQQTSDAIGTLERAMGVAQHHDAVSGTERQHVANDYSKRLARGTNECLNVIYEAFSKMLASFVDIKDAQTDIYYCSLLNVTECLPIEGKSSFTIILYNPLPRNIDSWIRVPTVSTNYVVQDASSGGSVVTDFSPVYPETKMIPERVSHANYNMVFKASLPALGTQVYSVTQTSKQDSDKDKVDSEQIKPNDVIMLKNEYLQLTFDSNGNLMQIDNLDTFVSTKLSQVFCYYNSKPGNNSQPDFQASGAYVFRPDTSNSTCLTVSSFTVFRGDQFDEIHQIFNPWISQTVRLYIGATNAEFEWQVGPIDVDDNVGKEVVTKFMSELSSNSKFYTDSNGREILLRKRDFRPSWSNFNQTESVSGNYYPINSRIFIRDEVSSKSLKFKKLANSLRQLTIVTDRSEGGSSVNDGSIEVMLHRRTLFDDSLGVAEPINERGSNGKGLIVKGTLRLIFNTTTNSARVHRELSHRINSQPLVIFAIENDNSDKKLTNFEKLAGWSGIKNSLPANLHLLTLTKEYGFDTQNTLLIRIEHFYEKNEDSSLSQPVTINLQTLFNQTFNLLGIEELGLGANMNVEELNQRLVWTPENTDFMKNEFNYKPKHNSKSNDIFTYTFQPMQIRTFRLWYMPKSA